MTLGAEPRKVALLIALAGAAAAIFYVNLGSEEPAPAPPAASAPPAAVVETPVPVRPSAATPAPAPATRRTSRRDRVRGDSFRPMIGFGRNEERPDLAKIDPTLRFDLLKKVQGVERSGGVRNLFQFTAAPPPPEPPAPKVKITPQTPGQIAQGLKPGQQPGQPGQAVKPPPPPITLKFYGYSEGRVGGGKRAFFLDGEDIFVAAEGELIKKRYKVIRIGG
ncbi:MAG: hypothetical protein ACKV22_10105, partial [Bryobacteraceae bacterium]